MSAAPTRRWYQFNLGQLFRWLYNYDRYTLQDGNLIRHQGRFRTSRIPLAQIRSWRVEPEMGVDVVLLEVDDLGSFTWLDYDNDLLTILQQQLPQREFNSRP